MTKELLKALQLIKNECEKHVTTCEQCPMRNGEGGCGITDINNCPSDWKLEKREVYF